MTVSQARNPGRAQVKVEKRDGGLFRSHFYTCSDRRFILGEAPEFEMDILVQTPVAVCGHFGTVMPLNRSASWTSLSGSYTRVGFF